MNTAADLRRFNDNKALEKAITNVMAALEKEPLGLEISQLMTVCRLSNRTTKHVLSIIKAECTDGVWYLDKKRKIDAESLLAAQFAPSMGDKMSNTLNIENEKAAFLDIYKYYPSAIKFTFDVENECFVLSKKNPLDHEVEAMSQMNQQWWAWFKRAKLEYEKSGEQSTVGQGIILRESDIDQAIDAGPNAVQDIQHHVEHVIINKALSRTRGNQTKAADLVGWNRGTFRNRNQRFHKKGDQV